MDRLRAEAARRIAVEGPKLQHALQSNTEKLKAGIAHMRAEQAKKAAERSAGQQAVAPAAPQVEAAAQAQAVQLSPPRRRVSAPGDAASPPAGGARGDGSPAERGSPPKARASKQD